MVERVVFHLGFHKTGTTSIQAALGDAFEALLEHRVLYPRAGRSGPGHALLPEEVEYTDSPVNRVASHLAILEEVRRLRPSTVLISAENLSLPDRPRLLQWARAFCRELSPARVDLLVYVRPQWEFIEAVYAERVKNGTVWGTFEDFLPWALTAADFDYPRKLSPWERAFPGRLELRPYPSGGKDGDSVADFWDRVGLEAPLPAQRRDNPRTGARTTEMLRLLRAILADHHLDDLLPPVAEPHPRPQRRAVIETMHRAHLRIAAAWPDDRPFGPMSGQTAERVTAHFAASNEQLVELYGRARDLRLSRAPIDREPSRWSLAAASPEERRFFAELVQATLAELRPVREEHAPAAPPGPAPARGPAPSPAPPTPKPSLAKPLTRAARRGRRRARRGHKRLGRAVRRTRRRLGYRHLARLLKRARGRVRLRTRLGLRRGASDGRPSDREGRHEPTKILGRDRQPDGRGWGGRDTPNSRERDESSPARRSGEM